MQSQGTIDIKSILLSVAEHVDIFHVMPLNHGNSGKTVVDATNGKMSHTSLLKCGFGFKFVLVATSQMAVKGNYYYDTLVDFATGLITPTKEQMIECGKTGMEISATTKRGNTVTVGFDLSNSGILLLTSSSFTIAKRKRKRKVKPTPFAPLSHWESFALPS